MDTPFQTSFILIVITIFLIYIYLVKNFNYWKKRNVNGPEPKFLYGTFPTIITQKQNLIYDMKEIYQKYKNKENFVGVFTIREPQLLILSPLIARQILVNKFKSFHDNTAGAWVNRNCDRLIANNPFLSTGHRWKEIRSEITPALSSIKMKASFPVMQQICNKMSKYIKNILSKNINNSCINAKNLASRFTCESVTNCIYGIESGSFTENNSPILSAAEQMVNEFVKGYSLNFITSVIPIIKKFYTFRFFSDTTETFFINLMNDEIELRIKHQINRSDFLNHLLQLKEKKNLTNFEMVSHTLTFFIDGFETSASLISHCLLLLARNSTEQELLRSEINNNLDDDKNINFDKLLEMEYLDLCIQETLRLFTPLLFVSKICTEPIELENTHGRILQLQIGDVVHIPIHCFHTDEQYFVNPEKFIPERFSNKNCGLKKLKDEGKFLPFSDGPRICLGMNFGLIQAKSAVCEIIKNFEITVNERTRTDNYISNSQTLIALLHGGVFLNFKEILN